MAAARHRVRSKARWKEGLPAAPASHRTMQAFFPSSGCTSPGTQAAADEFTGKVGISARCAFKGTAEQLGARAREEGGRARAQCHPPLHSVANAISFWNLPTSQLRQVPWARPPQPTRRCPAGQVWQGTQAPGLVAVQPLRNWLSGHLPPPRGQGTEPTVCRCGFGGSLSPRKSGAGELTSRMRCRCRCWHHHSPPGWFRAGSWRNPGRSFAPVDLGRC